MGLFVIFCVENNYLLNLNVSNMFYMLNSSVALSWSVKSLPSKQTGIKCISLGSQVNISNNIKQEINMRIQSANKCCYGMLKHFKSKLLTYTTKIKLYKTLIKPVLTYGSETWTLTEHTINQLGIFERKILRKIYGPTQENGEWHLKYNKELYDLYKAPDIITDIKISRLKWAGHIQRMNDSEMVKRISEYKPDGRRRVGRPKFRWMDGIIEDVKRLKITNWWMAARNREAWRKILREAVIRPGLLSQI